MVEIHNLYKNYGKTRALDGAEIVFRRGEVTAVMGPNGSGKTTLLKCILGLVNPDTGIIKVLGSNPNIDIGFKKFIGYMPQAINYPHNLKVGELMKLLTDLRGRADDEELVNEFGIKDVYHKKFGHLSGGMKQRVSAAFAFLFNPDILVLDEPTSSLDPLSAEIMKAKISKSKLLGKTIIISSHIVSEVEETADRIAYMLEGKIVLNKYISELCNGTGHIRLSKVIAGIIRD